jgi:leucyl aminopeptidase
MPLKITARAAEPVESSADVVVVGVWTLTASKKGRLADLADLDRALGGALAKTIAKEDFKGKKDQILSIPTLGRLPASKLVVMGLGDSKEFTDGDARSFAAKAARGANGEKAKSLVLGVPEGFDSRYRHLAEGLELGAHRTQSPPRARSATSRLVRSWPLG